MNQFGKLRYQMETPMADDIDPTQDPQAGVNADPGADAGPPEGHEEFAKHLDYAMANHPHLKNLGAICKKYGMEEGGGEVPGATDAGLPPGGAEDPSVMRNQRADVAKTKYQRQLDDQEKRIKAAEQALIIESKRQKVEKYELALTKLGEEFDVDVATELEDCVGLDQAGFDKHLARIKRYAAMKTPVGGDLPYDAIVSTPTGDKDLNDPQVEVAIHRYMRANPEFTQKHGEKAFMEAARVLKYVA